jgi:NADH-quinone oxidoreductase subunit E
MAWIVENRRAPLLPQSDQPLLTEEMKTQLTQRYLPRFPTKRAALLPALHMIQHKHGWISAQAMEEVGAFLGLAPAEVMDTATFYEEYWLKPKGKYLLAVCRSLSCEICGSRQVTGAIKKKLNVELGETTADGKFTLVEYECLGSCGTAPAVLVNEVLHEDVTPDGFLAALDALPDDPHHYQDPTVDWQE